MLCLENFTNNTLNTAPPIAVRRKRSSAGRRTGVAEQSSCSEASLGSAASSEVDDDCVSSRGDLTSAPSTSLASAPSTLDTSDPDGDDSFGAVAPLSHSAARHKMAVKPRRTYGAPRRNRPNQLSPGSVLPTTPEVNEDVTRSITPEVISNKRDSTKMTTSSRNITSSHTGKSEYNSHYAGNMISPNLESLSNQVPTDTKLKSSSLPPGLALSQMVGHSNSSPMKLSLSSNEELNQSTKIIRSRSNARCKNDDESYNHQQPILEKKSSHQSVPGISIYKNIDLKFNNVITGELQKRFNSTGDDEKLLFSENFEQSKSDLKHRWLSDKDKSFEKLDQADPDRSHSKKPDTEDAEEKQPTKKEESFFGRLLLRRSGKKNKKEAQSHKEEEDAKKSQQYKEQSYKSYHNDHFGASAKAASGDAGIIRQTKMTCSDQHAHKSIGQKVFSNQSHKRIDPRGGYANDPIIQESMNSFSKGSMPEYGINDVKHFSEREKIFADMQYLPTAKSREDISTKRLSSENVSKIEAVPHTRLRQRMEPLDIPQSPESQKKPPLLPRTTSTESKGFFPSINQSKVHPAKDAYNPSKFVKSSSVSSKMSTATDEQLVSSPKTKSPEIFGFGPSPYNNTTPDKTKQFSYSVSPPKSIWPQSYNPEHKSSSQGSLDPQPGKHSKPDNDYFGYSSQSRYDTEQENSKYKPKIAGLSSYQQKISQIHNHLNGEGDFVDSKQPVLKSQSFRINSENVPASKHDMPSLPPMFGISESSMDSWESTYKKNLKEASEPSSLELGSDSLMTFNYKPDELHFSEPNVFLLSNINEGNKENLRIVNENVEETLKATIYQKQTNKSTSHLSKSRDTDISTIEANIDSIIGSPKPLNCIALKSTSLDSVKSFSEKTSDGARKSVSNECISNSKIYINQPSIPEIGGSVITYDINGIKNDSDHPVESHVSVTLLNSETESSSKQEINKTNSKIKKQSETQNIAEKPLPKGQVSPRDNKTLERTNNSNSTIPEFMKIQLNKVDQKPASNVVLSTGEVNKSLAKAEKDADNTLTKKITYERSVSNDPKSSDKILINELSKSESDRNVIGDNKEITKPQRKFSSEDVEILEKTDSTIYTNNVFNIPLKKTGSQSLLNRSTELLNVDNSKMNGDSSKPAVPTSLNFRKSTGNSPASMISPTNIKPFTKSPVEMSETTENKNDTINKRQSTPNMGFEMRNFDQTLERNNAHNIKRMSSHELLLEQSKRIDRSSSSSDDCNLDSAVIYRKKSMPKNGDKKDDEPELMKVFARRSLKLKDCEMDMITQDIMKLASEESKAIVTNTEEVKKPTAYEQYPMNKSRDSDKENESDSAKDNSNTLNKTHYKNTLETKKPSNDVIDAQKNAKKTVDSNPVKTTYPSVQATKPINFGFAGYQRSISTNMPLSQTNETTNKIETKSESYRKEVSDSTPEKRLRNRTFPDSNNESGLEEISVKSLSAKIDNMNSIDTSSLPKRHWNQPKVENEVSKDGTMKNQFRKSSFTNQMESKLNKVNDKLNAAVAENQEKAQTEVTSTDVDSSSAESETDGSPQFKGILQMRAEWERRAKEAMTK